MGIRDRPTSPRSPWQNAYAERQIGTLRRDCLDHVLIFGVQHLRQILTSYSSYYNKTRTHLRMRRCGGRSSDAESLSPRPFCPACIISMRGYNFRERQGQAAPELDHVAVAVLPVVEELEIGADRIERHLIAVGATVEHASAPVTDRLQTEKLVPQPQAAVAFGFLILNDALIRSST
jgi:hypothetical protein